MAGRHVIDASATIAWALNEDGIGPELDPLFVDAELVVPWLWRLEVANVLLVLERRGKLLAEDVTRLCALLDDLDVETFGEPIGRSVTWLTQIARPHQLSSYDAVYLDLATSEGLPLVTGDNNLRTAAHRSGVVLPWKGGTA